MKKYYNITTCYMFHTMLYYNTVWKQDLLIYKINSCIETQSYYKPREKILIFRTK